MTEIRELLESEAARIRPEWRGTEPVRRTVARRHRSRRVTIAVIALAVATAGSVGAIRAFQGGGVRLGADPSWPGVWPHTTRDQGELAQRNADARPVPNEQHYSGAVLSRFVSEVIGWEDVEQETAPGSDTRPGVISYSVTCRPEPAGDGCQGTTQLVVTLEQLVRRGSGGLWWVTQVDGLPVSQLEARISASPAPPPEEEFPPPPGTQDEARAGKLVKEFLDRRLAGSGAERYLTEDALAAFETGRDGLEPLYEERFDGAGITYYETVGRGVLVSAELIDLDGHGCYEQVVEEYEMHPDEPLIRRAVRLDGIGSGCPGATGSEGEVEGFVESFLLARIRGSGAEPFLSPKAREQYAEHEARLRLYSKDYQTGTIFGVRMIPGQAWEASIRLAGDTCRSVVDESLTVRFKEDGGYQIVGVSRDEVPPCG